MGFPARGILWTGAAAVIVSACDPGSRAPVELVIVDSAGVRIHEAPPGAEAVVWTVGEEPVLRVEGDARGGLPSRAEAGRLFGDGSFVIADGGSGELRFYTSRGTLERTVGGGGPGSGGPGSRGFLHVSGDSLWAYDGSRPRIRVLDPDGDEGRRVPLDSTSLDGPVIAHGVFEDGALLVAALEPPAPGVPGTGLVHARLHRMEPDHRGTTDYGRFFVAASYWEGMIDTFEDAAASSRRRGMVSVHGMDWFYSDGEENRVEQYDPIGQLHAVYTRRRPPSPEGDGERDEPPPYEGLILDHGGNVWARRGAGAAPPNCWDVYQQHFPLLAEVCLPEGLTVLDVGRVSILGVQSDDQGGGRVVVYRLSKG